MISSEKEERKRKNRESAKSSPMKNKEKSLEIAEEKGTMSKDQKEYERVKKMERAVISSEEKEKKKQSTEALQRYRRNHKEKNLKIAKDLCRMSKMEKEYERLKKMGQEEAHARVLENNALIEETFDLVQYLELLQKYLRMISEDNTSQVQQS